MKVGDYVRTIYGIIGKLNIINDTIAVANWQGDYELEDITIYEVNDNKIYKSEILKSSPNIIDLIEVGDYVNGKKVAVNCKENGGNMVLFTDMGCANEKEIKSIVTREQFESMEYKAEK